MIGAAFSDMRRSAVRTAAAIAAMAVATAADAALREFSDEEVTAAVKLVIAERSKDGIFSFTDVRTGDQLSLVLDNVRVVRGLPGFGWFPNVSFHDRAITAKKYVLDFWLRPHNDRLKLAAIRLHKAPKADGAGWMSITRPPLAWWWLPTMERASAVAGVPAWEIMGAIHAHIADSAHGDTLELADATGERVALQLVDIEQPVGRSKTDGRYFACAELRKIGNEPGFYSSAYWFDAKTKRVSAGIVKKLDAASTGRTKTAAEPRCDVGGTAFDVVD